MLQRVLVLEKNQETAERLVTALKRNGAVTVSLVPTMREACLIVAQQPQDLAFIPLEDAGQLLHSLRALQPDLKMIVTTANSNDTLSNEDRGVFQGLLHNQQLEKALPGLLDGRPTPTSPRRPNLARLQEACRKIALFNPDTRVQMAVLSFHGQLMGFCGQGQETDAALIAELLNQSWRRRKFTAQLRYLQLPDYYDPRLIYSRAVAGAILTLVAEPELSITDLRRLADRLARNLSGPGPKEDDPDPSHLTLTTRPGRSPEEQPNHTYAIAWRSVKPLPIFLQKLAQECLITLAAENGCHLRHHAVTPTVINLLISWKMDKTPAWITYMLKSGIDREIQSRFNIRASIWRKGFYAAESDQPLKEAELNMLLAP